MKIIISGISGKMGKTLLNIINGSTEHEVVAGVDNYLDESINVDIYKSFKDINLKSEIDCIIDFSVKDAIYDILPFAIKNNLPVVLATTGFNETDEKYIINASKNIAILKSGNMSYGVNAMVKIIEYATSLLKDDCDIEIIETHHNQKIDAPSGTALMILNTIQNVSSNLDDVQYGRKGIIGKRTNKEIGVHSVRGGSIVGKHEVQFLLNGESITIKHEAESKSIFALGSLKAAKFLLNKKPGLYTMQDLD